MPREKWKAPGANPGEHARRNNKTKRHKGDWWQISEPNLDCQPGGTLDHAESQPRPEHSQRKTRRRRDCARQGRGLGFHSVSAYSRRNICAIKRENPNSFGIQVPKLP